MEEDAQGLAALRTAIDRAVTKICPRYLSAGREDLVQNAVIKVLDLIKRRQPEDNEVLSSFYLARVAHSVLVDELRRRRRHPEDENEVDQEIPATAADPEQRALGRELGRELRHCLGSLAATRRSACTLFLLGHGLGEIARLLEWSAKKAENALYRGLADLRSCLAQKGLAP